MLVSRGQGVFFPALMKRTHHCSELRKSDAGSVATLVGWVDSVRDHGGILFVDLRDREGLTQIVLDPSNAALEAQFGRIRRWKKFRKGLIRRMSCPVLLSTAP